MAMSAVWLGMIVVSLLCGLATGNGSAVATAAVTGAADAVELCISMAGLMCLWTGVMEVMKRSGLAEKLSHLLAPILKRLFPAFQNDAPVLRAISANVSANLLGLGNAATPLGLEASRLMAEKTPGVASDDLCMFVVCNTASITLLPTTVASIRAANGCAAPFDILPATWFASTLSVLTGLCAARLFSHIWPKNNPRRTSP